MEARAPLFKQTPTHLNVTMVYVAKWVPFYLRIKCIYSNIYNEFIWIISVNIKICSGLIERAQDEAWWNLNCYLKCSMIWIQNLFYTKAWKKN